MKRLLPVFDSDEEAEAFVEDASLTDYDLSGMRMVKFEIHTEGMQGGEAVLDARQRLHDGDGTEDQA